MPITVEHNYFEKEEEAVAEIQAAGLHLAKEELPPSEGTPLHWHEVDVHVYIQAGKFRFQDPATGKVHECVAGTKFVIPPRTLHIEEEHHGYTAIIGLSVPFDQIDDSFVRPPEELER